MFAKVLREIIVQPKLKASLPPFACINSLIIGQNNEHFYIAKMSWVIIWLIRKLCKALINIEAKINVMIKKARD